MLLTFRDGMRCPDRWRLQFPRLPATLQWLRLNTSWHCVLPRVQLTIKCETSEIIVEITLPYDRYVKYQSCASTPGDAAVTPWAAEKSPPFPFRLSTFDPLLLSFSFLLFRLILGRVDVMTTPLKCFSPKHSSRPCHELLEPQPQLV